MLDDVLKGKKFVVFHNIATESEAEERAVPYTVMGWHTKITENSDGLFDLTAMPPDAAASPALQPQPAPRQPAPQPQPAAHQPAPQPPQPPQGQIGAINRDFFFLQVKKVLFPSGSLHQTQVDGLTAILNEWESSYAHRDDRWLAYALGTTYYENGEKFQPIREIGEGRGKKYGEVDPETGQVYYGRGFVQLTWRVNYEKMGKEIGVDLVHFPDLALDLDNATKILFVGMIKGLFTGKKLGDFFNAATDDWVNARTIINDHDRANIIAGFGHDFYAAISYKK